MGQIQQELLGTLRSIEGAVGSGLASPLIKGQLSKGTETGAKPAEPQEHGIHTAKPVNPHAATLERHEMQIRALTEAMVNHRKSIMAKIKIKNMTVNNVNKEAKEDGRT